MSPSKSEETLIREILEALSYSGKTAIGIFNFIKVKYKKDESVQEIKKVIGNYLLNDKVKFDPYLEVYRLKKKLNNELEKSTVHKSNFLERKKETIQSKILFIESPGTFNIPEKISFLNELYKRREKLMLLPIDERLNNKRLEIIEILSEIKELKPIATQIFIDLNFNSKLKVLNSLVPTLKNELRIEIKAEDGNREFSDKDDEKDDANKDLNFPKKDEIKAHQPTISTDQKISAELIENEILHCDKNVSLEKHEVQENDSIYIDNDCYHFIIKKLPFQPMFHYQFDISNSLHQIVINENHILFEQSSLDLIKKLATSIIHTKRTMTGKESEIFVNRLNHYLNIMQ